MKAVCSLAVCLLTFLTMPRLGASEYLRGSDMGGGIGGVLYDLKPLGNTTAPHYYHYDGRGDVVGQTDSGGNLTYQAAYTADGVHNPATSLNFSGVAPGTWGAARLVVRLLLIKLPKKLFMLVVTDSNISLLCHENLRSAS